MLMCVVCVCASLFEFLIVCNCVGEWPALLG